MDRCQACAAGTFQFASGGSSCLACPMGAMQPGQGATSCLECPPGYMQGGEGMADCNACGAGRFAAGKGALFCDICDSGSFQPTANGTSCVSCRPGHAQSRTGASACEACTAGHFQSGAGEADCSRCGYGTFQPVVSSTGCLECGPGTALAETGRASMFSCAGCTGGTFASARGSSSCLECLPGTFRSGDGGVACAACKPGTFEARAGSRGCERCPAGTVATGAGGGACSTCAAGTYGSSVGASELSECRSCRPGRFSTGVGQVSETACLPCPLGSFSSEDRGSCIACEDGTFCPAGSAQPIQCKDPGLLCNGSSMGARDGVLAVLIDECSGALVCPAGTRCSEGTDDKGVLADERPGQTHFEVFVGGSLSLELGCPSKILSYGYARVDTPADNSGRRVLFRLLPTGCRAGSFLLGDICKPCAGGTFSTAYGALAEGACAPCSPGTYASDQGFTACTRCAPGTFQARLRTSDCMPCPQGRFQSGSGASYCDACMPGTFRDGGAGTACSQCLAGTFQARTGAAACVECDSRSEFSSQGDAGCARCGEKPRSPQGCRAASLPDNTSSLWIAVTGGLNDECVGLLGTAGVGAGLVRAKAFRLEPAASCRHTLRVLGRPELSASAVIAGPARADMLAMAYNETFYPALCRQGEGFAVFYRARPLGAPAFIEIWDPAGRHLLFSGSCGAGGGECRASGFCPTQDVRVRVRGSTSAPDVLVRAGPESLQCPPTSGWLLSFELRGPYGARFPGDALWFDVRVLDAPDRLLAFRLSLRIRPGFTLLSFRSSLPGGQSMAEGTLDIEGDCSGAVLVGGQLGQLGLRLDAEHSGLLRALEVVDARFMLSGGWFSVGVVGLGGSCLRNGFVDALVDYPRCTALLVEPSRTQLVHWRGVQAGAGVFPMRIDVRGVWNTRGPARPVEASCLSLSTAVLEVASCQRIVAKGPGAGLVLVRFESLETVVSVRVLQPADVRASLDPVTGRATVAGTLLGRALDLTPYVLREDVVACADGANVTVGLDPVLLRWQCPPARRQRPDVLFLLAGLWTRQGFFQAGPSVLSSARDRAAALVFEGREIVPFPHLASEDPSRVLHDGGWLQLVRQGASPRCVSIAGRWRIPVLPPGPVALEVRLSSSTLVVQQDLFKLVPSRAELAAGHLVLTDGSLLDVRDRLLRSVTDNLLVAGDGSVQTRFEPGPGTVNLRLPGFPCVTTSANVSVYANSVVSSELVCPRCPALLADRADPLSLRWPDRYPARVPVEWFVVRRTLVDGGSHDGLEQLQVGGAGLLEGGHVQAVRQGILAVSTAFTPNRVLIPVIQRWATSWRLLCNGRACDPGMKLAAEGGGADEPPFRYLARLSLAVELTLHNGSVLLAEDPPDVALHVNGEPQPFREVPLARGGLAVRVILGAGWAFAEPEALLDLRADWLASLQLSVPPVLRQLHCTRVWERGAVSLQGVLSDGARALVPGRILTDETFLRLDRTGLFVEALWPGKSCVNASFGGMRASAEVLATMDSLVFTGLNLDALPREWTAPLLARLPMRAVLEPFGGDLAKVVHWQTQPEGVLDVLPHGELVLRSDHYEPVVITGIIRSCLSHPPRVFRASVQVNVLADRLWQVDFGGEQGAPLPAVPVGAQLSIPVFLHSASPLVRFRAAVSLPGLQLEACAPGELPFSRCELKGFALLVGSFPASQRTGRLLLGTLSGTVLVDGLSRLRVSLREPGNTTYEFTVRLGVGPVHSVLPRVNAVTPGFSNPGETAWQAQEPTRLTACCDVLAVGSRSPVQHLLPSSFQIQSITLEPGGISLPLTDPRLRVEFDELLLRFDQGAQTWTVGHLVPLFEESTRIELTYQHPGAQVRLSASILVTLTEPDEIILLPARLVVKRVHCSPTVFQSRPFTVALMMREGTVLPLSGKDLGSAGMRDPSLARVDLAGHLVTGLARVDPIGHLVTGLAGVDPIGHLVTGLAIGSTSLVVSAFGLKAEIPVVVLDESAVLSSISLPDPYLLAAPRGQVVPLRLSGTLESEEALADAGFLVEAVTPSGSVAEWVGGGLAPLENTLPHLAYRVVVVLPACSGAPALVVSSSLVVRLLAGSLPDVVVDASPAGVRVSLAADWVLAFVITLRLGSEAACLPGPDWPTLADCAVQAGRVILAGSFGEPRPGPVLHLALLAPAPSCLSGYVELFSGLEGSVRREIVAGRLCNLSSGMPVSLPAADPATLAKQYLAALSRPFDPQAMRETRFTLQLLTDRQRLVDVRLYSNELELSAMFGVTDRYFAPDEAGTVLDVVFHSKKLPAHPNATDTADGIRVRAQHFVEGWYVVQWAEAIPHLALRVSYEVSTASSPEPWEYAVPNPLVTGRPLHECPRLATDRASFLVVYRIPGPLPADWSDAHFACAARVPVRRVSIFRAQSGVVTASVAYESFIRIAQANKAIRMKNAYLAPNRKLLADGVELAGLPKVELVDLRIINDTADPVLPCPAGTFYSRNGTYERLPNHAVLGPDCYGMACIDGYLLAGDECLPAPVAPEVVWVCVLVILGVGLLLSCVLCALYMGRRVPAPPVDLTTESWPDSSHPSEPFAEDDADFKNIVLGSYMDDFSRDMLDDDDEFFPNSRICRLDRT